VGDLWLFGYGSLIWKPGFEYAERRMATVQGWHRSSCLRIARFRATRDQNGLMMVLDRGGQCQDMIFPRSRGSGPTVLNGLFRRELVVNPPAAPPRWLAAQAEDGPIRALGFAIDRRSPFYAGQLPLE
jgi:cation transport protein ChaC